MTGDLLLLAMLGIASPCLAQSVDSSTGGIDGAGQPTSTTEPGTRPEPIEGALDPRLIQPTRPGTVLQDVQPSRQSKPILQLVGEPPRWLRVTGTTARTVTLAWSPTSGSSGYWVHLADSSGKYYRGAALITDTMTTVGSLIPAMTYSFKVSAVYPPGTRRSEGFSEAVSATTASVRLKQRS